MVAVAFAAVSKRFPDGEHALRGLTLDIDDGTICCLIGPSGCGKSTALRLLAGLEQPTSGQVRLGRKVVNDVPTRHRNLGLVTQDDALLPKSATRRSVALPLELRDADAAEIDRRVDEQADTLSILQLLHRRPRELSGGQVQLAQIARALVARPDVLLLDEPLARIDHRLRTKVRADLVRLQRRHAVTTLWVTADQADAMAVADRLGVLIRGRLEQIGAPLELYEAPRTEAVARFVGEPEMSVFDATVRGVPGDFWLEFGGTRCRVRTPAVGRLAGRRVRVGIRPHHLHDPDAVSGRDAVEVTGQVRHVEPLGHQTVAVVDVPGAGALRWAGARPATRPGDTVTLVVDPELVHLFDPDTGVALHHPAVGG